MEKGERVQSGKGGRVEGGKGGRGEGWKVIFQNCFKVKQLNLQQHF